MNGEADTRLAIDIGGTLTRAAVVSSDGRVLNRDSASTPARTGPDAVIDTCVSLARAVLDRHGQLVRAAGVGVAGPVQPASGIVHQPPNLVGWRRVPLQERLAEQLGCVVVVGNDANLAALAEHRYGAGRGCDLMVYLTVSTGVGGAILTRGQPLEGARGLASEPGHFPVQLDGPACTCGSVGCLESLASGHAIAARAREAVQTGKPSLLQEHQPLDITARHVIVASRRGDPLARSILGSAIHALGRAVVGLVNLIDPARVVIGGGVANALGQDLLVPVRAMVASDVMASDLRHVDVVLAELGDDGVLLGAAVFSDMQGRDSG